MPQTTQIAIREILKKHGAKKESVIPVLQAIQGAFNYLPTDALKYLVSVSGITPADIFSVSTFYSQFRHEPMGKHKISVCVGTACYVKGAMFLYDALRRQLKLEDGKDTDAEGTFTLGKVACLGCCTIAPAVQIDETTYGHVNTDTIPEILEDFLLNQQSAKKEGIKHTSSTKKNQGEIRIGLGSCCIASGSSNVKDELEQTLIDNHLNVVVKRVGCVGICNQVPMLEIHKPGQSPVFYTKIQEQEVRKVVLEHFSSNSWTTKLKNNITRISENLVFEDVPKTMKNYSGDDINTPVSEFLMGQVNIATEFRGEMNPTDLTEYRMNGGFLAFAECLHNKSPQNIVEEVIASGLRGRGGAGFPTSKKWEIVQRQSSEKKYIICNGDEGDPGAFMDRMLLESYPFRVIEGMLIAALAVGATDGLFYIRAEYKLAVKQIKEAIKKCQSEGFLGKNILGSDFSMDISIFEGAGAFVCGEETALIASVEGKRGFPSLRPPYPAINGLWNHPTLINNTETFSLVPWIISHGSQQFSQVGTPKSTGTKVFALAGKVNRGGLIEVPMGTTIRQIVMETGGGIPNGKAFKAVQIGGPSGGCIPAHLADTSIDFESLAEVGAMMGSGGLIVLDETDCMVSLAHYFLEFTQNQSCGKCTFCRIGTRKMWEIMDKICRGKAVPEDIDLLETLAQKVKKGSLCGLGKTAPNPVLSTLKYFREEYNAHIQGKCPTGKCKDLIRYEINDECIGCTRCAQKCPVDAIHSTPHEMHTIDTALCIRCDACKQTCPVNAVVIVHAQKTYNQTI